MSKYTLASFRLLAQSLTEEQLMEEIKEGFDEYAVTGKKEDRPMSTLALLVAKWGDEMHGLTPTEIMEHSNEVEEFQELKDNYDGIKGILDKEE